MTSLTIRTLAIILAIASVSLSAFADGGRLRFSKPAGPFLVTLFTTPEPLTPGMADFSLMVQDAQSGAILPDARVTLTLTPRQGSMPSVHAVASTGLAVNRLLQAAQFNLPASGNWHLHLDIQQGTRFGYIDADIPVDPGSRKALLVWIFAILPCLALLLFVLHQRQMAFLHPHPARHPQ